MSDARDKVQELLDFIARRPSYTVSAFVSVKAYVNHHMDLAEEEHRFEDLQLTEKQIREVRIRLTTTTIMQPGEEAACCIECDKVIGELDVDDIEWRWILSESQLLCDTCYGGIHDAIGDKGMTLAEYLEVSPQELETYGDENEFSVSVGRTRYGTSPAEARRHVARIKERLAGSLHDRTWQQIHAGGWTYQGIEHYLKTVEEKNTLYWLLSVGDSLIAKYIRAAWNGEEIRDEREWTRTSAGEYLVLTDDEADERMKMLIESYVDECILPEMPEHARNYFDMEKFSEAARHDGRGHWIAGYDSNENEHDAEDGETYYIYRTG